MTSYSDVTFADDDVNTHTSDNSTWRHCTRVSNG